MEGYTESAATGILAGINAARYILGEAPLLLPETTMLGALVNYITDGSVSDFQPMGANMGILPELPERIRDKKATYMALAQRGMQALEALLAADAAQTGTE